MRATYISEAVEIDLYECLKHDPYRTGGKVRTHGQYGPFYIPLTRTRVRYGYRLWFMCPGCQRRTTKMYLYYKSLGCRKCLDLKYETQYDKRPIVKYEAAIRRLLRYEKQNRRVTYDGTPTQFGERMISLLDGLEYLEYNYGFNQEREFARIRDDIDLTTKRTQAALYA